MWDTLGVVTPSLRGLCCSSMALQVPAASWGLPTWVVVMVGMESVPRPVLTAADEQHEDRDIRDIQDIPCPLAMSTEQAVLEELRARIQSSAEVRGKTPEGSG